MTPKITCFSIPFYFLPKESQQKKLRNKGFSQIFLDTLMAIGFPVLVFFFLKCILSGQKPHYPFFYRW
jgi:hypothetical protein